MKKLSVLLVLTALVGASMAQPPVPGEDQTQSEENKTPPIPGSNQESTVEEENSSEEVKQSNPKKEKSGIVGKIVELIGEMI